MLPKKIKIMTFAVTVTFAATMACAQTGTAREFADIYIDCGLGAMIAPRTPVVAAITNVTFDLGTTAILSNASSPDTCHGGQARAAAFIHEAYDSLEVDLAQGQGEYLDSLTLLVGVQQADKAAFVQTLRDEFANQVAQQSYAEQTTYEKAENLYNLLYNQVERRS